MLLLACSSPANVWENATIQGNDTCILLVDLLGLLNKSLQRYQFLLVNRSAFEAIEKELRRRTKRAEINTGSLKPLNITSLSLQNVSFSYGDKTILNNFSASFPVNSLNVLAAPSGSGKTTLLDILAGLSRPLKGSVMVDEIDLKDIDLQWWRGILGYVPQELELLHQSIRLNISVGINVSNDLAINNALGRVGLTEFVTSLEDGLDTVVGEKGSVSQEDKGKESSLLGH